MFEAVRYKKVFNRTGRTDKNGKAPLIVEAFLKSKRAYFSAGVKLKPHPKDPTKLGEKLSQQDDQRLYRLESALRKYEDDHRRKNDGYCQSRRLSNSFRIFS